MKGGIDGYLLGRRQYGSTRQKCLPIRGTSYERQRGIPVIGGIARLQTSNRGTFRSCCRRGPCSKVRDIYDPHTVNPDEGGIIRVFVIITFIWGFLTHIGWITRSKRTGIDLKRVMKKRTTHTASTRAPHTKKYRDKR